MLLFYIEMDTMMMYNDSLLVLSISVYTLIEGL